MPSLGTNGRSPEMIFRGRWSLTLHWRSILNLEVFEFNWKVVSTSEEESGGERITWAQERLVFLRFIPLFGYVRTQELILIMFLDLLSRALTLSLLRITQPIIAKAILLLGLNDATSTVESFPVFSFPQAFSTPGLLSRRIGQTDLPLSSSSPHLIFFSIDLFTENIFNDRQTFQATTV